MRENVYIIFLITSAILIEGNNHCNLKTTEHGSVCVCSSSFCDTVPEVENLSSGEYQLYSTSKDSLGFQSLTGKFSNPVLSASTTITISDVTNTHQSIFGFGGSFTDSAGINIANLPSDVQDSLLRSYFGKDGIEYSVCRVPVGGTDFSIRGYTYCDGKDETLGTFALQEEDLKYKIPLIQKAKQLRGDDSIKLFASAWSSPAWMKTNNMLTELGYLKDEYYELWVRYYIKFFDAYEKHNISFWGMTTQNEPISLKGWPINNIGWNYTQMNKWIASYLGPIIRSSKYKNTKIILHDDNRAFLPDLKSFTLSNEDVVQYADGIGVHWYTDFSTPASYLNLAETENKQLFRLATEACIMGSQPAITLGNWTRAESYIDSIFVDLEYDFAGWIDWNIALSETGGPSWVSASVDSSVIINGTSGEFYKQPMFYALGHFSKFIVPGSLRLNIEVFGNGIKALAFLRPDGSLAVTLWNRSDADELAGVNIMNTTEQFKISAHSLNTLLYRL